MEGLRSFIHKIKTIHKLLDFVGDGSDGGADLRDEVWGLGPSFPSSCRRSPGRKGLMPQTGLGTQKQSVSKGREHNKQHQTASPGPLCKGFLRRITQSTTWAFWGWKWVQDLQNLGPIGQELLIATWQCKGRYNTLKAAVFQGSMGTKLLWEEIFSFQRQCQCSQVSTMEWTAQTGAGCVWKLLLRVGEVKAHCIFLWNWGRRGTWTLQWQDLSHPLGDRARAGLVGRRALGRSSFLHARATSPLGTCLLCKEQQMFVHCKGRRARDHRSCPKARPPDCFAL